MPVNSLHGFRVGRRVIVPNLKWRDSSLPS